MSGAAVGARAPRVPRALAVLLLAASAAAAGTWYALTPAAVVSTDDAYAQADMTSVAPKVRGLIGEIAVRDNQAVRRGDLLVRIDPEEYRARLADAEAALAASRASLAAAEAALARLPAEQELADADAAAAASRVVAADAERRRAGADGARYGALARLAAASVQEWDRASAQAAQAAAESARTRAALAVARAQAEVVRRRRPELAAAVAASVAAEGRAAAALDLARQDLAHTEIRAAVDGVVGDRHVQLGDYVQPGTLLLRIVPLHAIYVTANFKETQTARMRPGQPAEVRFDASSEALAGVVESLAPGSGAQFALLPFEPGTGNFTKIVQRVPVRIRLAAPGSALLRTIRPGLSAVVRVRVAE